MQKEEELEVITGAGPQNLPPEREHLQDSLPDQIEQQVPTLGGMREIGPGLLSGTSGNDPSAVTAYTIDGANAGYGHLWLILLTTPLYFAVQFACAKIGRISQKGLSQLLHEQYGRPVAFAASLLLAISNIALIAADLAAVSSGFELITGITWIWFVVPVALVLWYLTVYRTFESFQKIFLTMSFVFVDPIKLIFWSNILATIIAPVLVITILLVGNNRTIMKNQRLSLLHNFGLLLITIILVVGAVLLFYGWATGYTLP